MKKYLVIMICITGTLLGLASLGIAGYNVYQTFTSDSDSILSDIPQGGADSLDAIEPFESASAFSDYLAEGEELSSSGYYDTRSFSSIDSVEESSLPSESAGDEAGEYESDTASRYSETNVQVAGIDEPDIVKTDGESIYFSNTGSYWLYDVPIPESDMYRTSEDATEGSDGSLTESETDSESDSAGDSDSPTDSEPSSDSTEDLPVESDFQPEYYYGSTRIIDALPAENPQEIATLDLTGDLLLTENSLIVLNYNSIQAYDISDPENPTEGWLLDTNDNTSILTSRLFDSTLYVITMDYIDYGTPCPIQPLLLDDEPVVSIRCTEIYHPTEIVQTDTTYTIFKINPDTGDIIDSTSFVGSASSSVMYMSPSSIYITYTYEGDYASILIDFFLENDDLLPNTFISKLKRLVSYDISQQAKMVELQTLLSQFEQNLDPDDQTTLDNNLQNRMDAYMELHSREFLFTGIVKINEETLAYEALGAVPGYLLNQFSIDEYNNNLRVATTIGNNWFSEIGSVSESANDVYVLDDEMRITGSVKNLGLTETIYSVRFVRDAGYVVTFLQTDPLYVLDLSDPQRPVLEGELEIPGYSSYLHPISDSLLLGVGEEDWNVKLSLFNVSNPRTPEEVTKFTMDEGWTDVNSTHHAFMIDTEHQIFFIPGNDTGYVFSYENEELTLVKSISGIQAKRALYIDDFLYIVGEDKLVVLDENTWERIGDLEWEEE